MGLITSEDTSVLTILANYIKKYAEVFVDEITKDFKGTWLDTPDTKNYMIDYYGRESKLLASEMLRGVTDTGGNVNDFVNDIIKDDEMGTAPEAIKEMFGWLRNEVRQQP